jgi:hypothetical protein
MMFVSLLSVLAALLILRQAEKDWKYYEEFGG